MKNALRLALTIILTCSITISFAQQNEWTWMKGSSAINGPASYGIQGTASASNTPGSLYESTAWTDLQGNFWLFGGLQNFGSEYNTLWKYDVSTNMWTWIKGSSTCCAAGVYGTQGMPDAANTPGARAWGTWQWVDASGNLWLYGGIGYDAMGSYQCLSDLWRYDVTTNEWTWMKGPSQGTIGVIHGTMGVPASNNLPGARAEGDAAWIDDSARLWLFGGALYFPQMGGWSLGGFGNDMWMWDPSSNYWTWMQGTTTLSGSGVYGTKGVADSSNYPPGRGAYTHWEDSAGNFYTFSGYNLGYCWNDLWKYDWHTNVFTWISGPSTQGGNGTYGTMGVPDTNNIPPARYENRVFWQDQCDNFWLWGGVHEGGNGWTYNDLWMYKPSTREWTWLSGENTGNFTGNFGTQGVSVATNEPPAKFGGASWIDSIGNLWMFGGGTAGFGGAMNDLWRYVPEPVSCAQQQVQVGFAAADTTICEKFCINFFDSSLNNPVAWEWNFPGGNPATSSQQNPANICYQNPGVFDVTLITTDANGNNDTLTLSNYITVYTNPFAPTITQTGNTLTSSPATSYQWQLNSVDIPGATNQSYTITQSGLYTVIIGDNNGCNAQASVDASLVGIQDAKGNFSVSVFPNPSSGIFNVDVLLPKGNEITLQIVNTLGQVISERREHLNSNHLTTAIDLNEYAAGIYFLNVKTGDASMQFKLVTAR